MKRLKKFQQLANFEKMIMTFIATRTNDKEIKKQIHTFRSLDKNKDGYITMRELKSVLKGQMTETELLSIVEGVDTDKNGAINYTEFIAATLNARIMNDSKKLKKAFDSLDANKDGEINTSDIEKLIDGAKIKFVDPHIIKDIILSCDTDNDGSVTFEEFQRKMSKLSTFIDE